MVKGKNINVYLLDGDVTGSVKCTLSNWTGIIYKIPRINMNTDIIKNRDDLKISGVYFFNRKR